MNSKFFISDKANSSNSETNQQEQLINDVNHCKTQTPSTSVSRFFVDTKQLSTNSYSNSIDSFELYVQHNGHKCVSVCFVHLDFFHFPTKFNCSLT